MPGKQGSAWVLALALAVGGVTLIGCGEEARDHLRDAGDSTKDAAESVGEAGREVVDDIGDAFDE